jgi:hypothetical protein
MTSTSSCRRFDCVTAPAAWWLPTLSAPGQLAAALMWCDDAPGAATPFVCLDERLRDAARREGFAILPA